MLILTRRPGETICIGDTVTVTVLGVGGWDSVQLGITAPRSVAVNREEIHERIRAQEQRDGKRKE